jgi:hypothetical protein
MLLKQGIDDHVQVSAQYFIELVNCQIHTVIRDPALREIIGSNALGAISATYLQPS